MKIGRTLLGGTLGGLAGGLLLGLIAVQFSDLAMLAGGSNRLLTGSSGAALTLVAAVAGSLVGAVLSAIAVIPSLEIQPLEPLLRWGISRSAVAVAVTVGVGAILGAAWIPGRSFLYGTSSAAWLQPSMSLGEWYWEHSIEVRTVAGAFFGATAGGIIGCLASIFVASRRSIVKVGGWLLWAMTGGFCTAGLGELIFGILFNTFGEHILSLRVHVYSFLYAGILGAWTSLQVTVWWWLARSLRFSRALGATVVATITGLSLASFLSLETTSRLMTRLDPSQQLPAFAVLEYFEGKRFPPDTLVESSEQDQGGPESLVLPYTAGNPLFQAFPDPVLLMLTTAFGVWLTVWHLVFLGTSPARPSALPEAMH